VSLCCMPVNVIALVPLHYEKFHVTLAYPCIYVCVLLYFSLLRWSPLVGADGNTSGGRPDGGSGAV